VENGHHWQPEVGGGIYLGLALVYLIVEAAHAHRDSRPGSTKTDVALLLHCVRPAKVDSVHSSNPIHLRQLSKRLDSTAAGPC